MALLYQGYAQAKGFQQINPSDNTPEKKRQEGIRQLSQMEKALNWRLKEAGRRQQDFAKVKQKEAQTRLSNEQLRRDVNEMWARAEFKHLESEMDRDVQQAERQQEQLKGLLSLTQSGAELLARQQEEKRKGQKALWKDNVDRYGVSPNIVRAINQMKKGVWDSTMLETQEYKELASKGMSDALIRQIHGMPTYLQIAVGEYDAVAKARQLGSQIVQYGDEPLQLGDTTITFNSAKASGDPVKLQHAQRLLRNFIDEQNGGPVEAKVKESSGAWRIEDQLWAAQFRQQEVFTKAKVREQKAEEVRVIFNQQLFQPQLDADGNTTGSNIDPGRAYLNTIEFIAGGENASREDLKLARQKVDAMILHDLEFGIGDISDEVKAILKFTPEEGFRGGGKDTIGNQWPKMQMKFEQALGARLQHENNLASANANKWKVQALQAEAEAYEFVFGGETPPSNDQMIARWKAYKEKGYTKAAQIIQTQMALDGANGINDSSALLRTKAKIARGEIFDADYVKLLNISNPLVRVEVEGLIAKHNRLRPTDGDDGTKKELDEWLQRTLEDLVPRKGEFGESRESLGALRRAKSIAYRHYKDYLTINGLDKHTQALKYTTDLMGQEINPDKGLFKVTYDKKQNIRNFESFRADLSRLPEKLSIEDDKKGILNDDTYLDTVPVLSESFLRQKSLEVNQGKNGAELPHALMLEMETGIPAIIQEQRQIEYYNNNLQEGQKPIKPYPESYIKAILENRNEITAKAQRRLSYRDPVSINRAYLESNKGMPYINRTIERAGNKVKESFTEDYGGYNSIETSEGRFGSFEEKGFHLTNTTLQDVVELGYDKAGAYRLTPELISKYASKAGLTLQSKYTAENQDKLFEVIFRDLGVAPFLENSLIDEDDGAFLDSSYEAVTSDKFEVSQWRSPAFMNDDAIKGYKIMMTGVA